MFRTLYSPLYSSRVGSLSRPPARNEWRNFAALNGLTNLVVNAFLVKDNAAACVIAFILAHKSPASTRLHWMRDASLSRALVLSLQRFWEYTHNDEQRWRWGRRGRYLQRFLLSFFFLFRSLLPAKECVPAASRQVLSIVTIIHGS